MTAQITFISQFQYSRLVTQRFLAIVRHIAARGGGEAYAFIHRIVPEMGVAVNPGGRFEMGEFEKHVRGIGWRNGAGARAKEGWVGRVMADDEIFGVRIVAVQAGQNFMQPEA